MSQQTGIEWTDRTWNPFAGCSIVSPGCTNCYAMKMAARIERMGTTPHYAGLTQKTNGGPVWTGAVNRAPDHIFNAPLRWKKPCMIFVNSMSDLFHNEIDDKEIGEVFDTMERAHWHIFQVLTKRSSRMSFWIQSHRPRPLPNVWIGVSVEDQKSAQKRIPALQNTPAAVRFLSCEPLLDAIVPDLDGIDWVICGGESGLNWREMRIEWAESLMHDCKATNTAFFMKQMAGKKPIPPDLLIRQFPKLRMAGKI